MKVFGGFPSNIAEEREQEVSNMKEKSTIILEVWNEETKYSDTYSKESTK